MRVRDEEADQAPGAVYVWRRKNNGLVFASEMYVWIEKAGKTCSYSRLQDGTGIGSGRVHYEGGLRGVYASGNVSSVTHGEYEHAIFREGELCLH